MMPILRLCPTSMIIWYRFSEALEQPRVANGPIPPTLRRQRPERRPEAEPEFNTQKAEGKAGNSFGTAHKPRERAPALRPLNEHVLRHGTHAAPEQALDDPPRSLLG